MTQTRNAAYLAQLTEAQKAFLDSGPVWFEASWAVGVWFSVLGSLLLVLRSRFALQAFALSLAGLLVSSLYSFVLAEPSSLQSAGTAALLFTLAIFVVLVGLWIYARAMRDRGVLG